MYRKKSKTPAPKVRKLSELVKPRRTVLRRAANFAVQFEKLKKEFFAGEEATKLGFGSLEEEVGFIVGLPTDGTSSSRHSQLGVVHSLIATIRNEVAPRNRAEAAERSNLLQHLEEREHKYIVRLQEIGNIMRASPKLLPARAKKYASKLAHYKSLSSNPHLSSKARINMIKEIITANTELDYSLQAVMRHANDALRETYAQRRKALAGQRALFQSELAKCLQSR